MYPQSRDARDGEVELVLNVKGLKFRPVTDNFRLEKSPCCGHSNRKNPPFSINKKNGLWTCFFEPCRKKGNWVNFCDLIGHKLQSRSLEADFVDSTPEWLDHFKTKNRTAVSTGKYPEILEYCLDRGISCKTLDAFRISYKWGQGIQVPIFAWVQGSWQRVNARNVMIFGDADKPKNFFEIKGAPTHFLLGNNTLDLTQPDKRIIITEGQWDMMAGYEIGLRNIFSLPNGAGNFVAASMLRYVPEDWKIYVCTDMDESGDKCAEKILNQIGSKNFVKLQLPYKDLNEWLIKDPNLNSSMVLDTAKGISVEKKPEFESLNFTDYDEEDDLAFFTTPWPKLNEFLDGGLRLGETTCVLAPAGTGKTTIVNHMALHVCSLDEKVGLISFEGTRSQLLQRVHKCALSIEDGVRLGLKNLTLTQMKGKETTLDEMVFQIEHMIEKGCKLIIVDNLNSLDGEISPQLQTFRKTVNLAVKNNIHLIMVTQPSKFKSGDIVTSFNQKGFSTIYQDTSNHINLNFDGERSQFRTLHVEKCRSENPGLNATLRLKYNETHKNYHQHELYSITDLGEKENKSFKKYL